MLRLEHRFRAMGGPCRLRLQCEDRQQGDAAIAAAVAEVERLEARYSRYRADSTTTRINQGAGSGVPTPIDSETATLLNYAHTAYHQSSGLFDLTSGVLGRAWDFRAQRVPDAAQLLPLLELVGWEQVQWDAAQVYLPRSGMEIDFGGCVKEYAADSVAARLRQLGIDAALVDLAGDLAVLGVPAGQSGWPVGIRHPREPEAAIASITLPEGGLASSGDYERCIQVDDRYYGHILHPRTGWPVSGPIAVSILAPQCLVAGSAATIAMLKPLDEAMAWLTDLGLPWLAIDAQLNCHGTIV